MNAQTNDRITKTQQDLAAGILSQARRDLRRFRSARRAPGRELYLDAYEWVISEDYSWPLSFRNVCQLLDLSPEELREEVLRETSLGTVDYWSRHGGRLLRQFQTSLRQIFIHERSHNPSKVGTPAHILH